MWVFLKSAFPPGLLKCSLEFLTSKEMCFSEALWEGGLLGRGAWGLCVSCDACTPALCCVISGRHPRSRNCQPPCPARTSRDLSSPRQGASSAPCWFGPLQGYTWEPREYLITKSSAGKLPDREEGLTYLLLSPKYLQCLLSLPTLCFCEKTHSITH